MVANVFSGKEKVALHTMGTERTEEPSRVKDKLVFGLGKVEVGIRL